MPFSKDFLLSFADYSSLSFLLDREELTLKRFSKILGPAFSLISFLEFPDESNRQTAIRHMRASNDELIDRIRNRRAQLSHDPRDLRFRAYSALLFMEIQDKIQVALRSLGKTFDDLRALHDEQIAKIFDNVPTLDIERWLAIEIEQQSSRELQGNDVYDIAALSAAIPYCDVVVSEKLWGHTCRVCGLDSKYKTKIFKSLSELASFCQEST